MKLSLKRQIPLAFLVALVLLVTIGLFSYRQIETLGEAVKWEKHTHDVLQQIDKTQALIVDAESAGRGFLISGDDEFLQSFDQTNQIVSENIQQLKTLMADNPEQSQNVSELETLVAVRLDLIRQFVEIRRAQGLTPTLSQSIGRGKILMDRVRAHISRMKDIEKNLLVEREKNFDDGIGGTYRILLIGSLAGIISLLLANLAIFRETGKRSRAEEELKIANRNLEKRVGERTAELSEINKQLEENALLLRRSESFVRAILDSLPAHIAVLDKKGAIVAVNRAWSEFAEANCSEEKLTTTGIGQNYVRVCEKSDAFDEDTGVVLKNLRAILNGEQKEFSFEYACHSPTRERWFLMQISRMEDGAVVSHIDITERKRAEIELKNSEEFNRSIFENSPDCVKILELDGTLHSMNINGMCIMEIEDFASFKGKIWSDFWSDKEKAKAIEAIELARQGKTAHFEGYSETAKGTSKYWDVTVAPVFDNQGKPRQIISTSRDITERQDAEKSRAYLASIVESSDDAIVSKDLNGIITSWNKGAENLFGYKAEEAIGKSVTILIPPDHTDEEPRILNRIRNGEKIVLYETVRQRKDASKVEVSLTVSPIFDGAGRIIGASKIAHDITTRRHDEAEREKLLAREQAARKDAEIANRLRDEFLATVSHELRAPLNSILGWARLMQQGRLDEKTTAKAIETIVRNAESQSRLIEDLLDVSRIISGKLRLEVMTIKPSSFVEAALESVRPAAEAKNIQLEIREDAGISHISGDPNRLQQVVWNLLSNAIKFTPGDGKVTVEIERTNGHVEIRVRDTGVGIKPEFLPHVFDRFSQADASSIRKFGGLGLGLAIVRHLTEMHGGTVRAESAGEGKGSTFVIKLPVIIAPPEESVLKSEGDRIMLKTNPNMSLDGLLILAVDDEEDTRQLLVQMLTQYGATVVTANSAEHALRTIEDQKPDVLVSDIGMPDEDGYSLIRKIRALNIDIPAIAMTAFTRAQDRMRALSSGFQNHVSKPVEPEELVTVIASLTGRLQLDEEE